MIDDIRINKAPTGDRLGDPKIAQKLLYAHILLDRSGSMESIRESAIDGVNEYIGSLANDKEVDSRISLTIFDSSGIDLIRDNIDAGRCAPLRGDEFQPRAMTPLNDAIGRTIAEIEAGTRRDGENVAFIILTDGLENASHEYNRAAIKALLERVQKEKNWLVLYLGANQDAFQEGVAHRGTTHGHTMQYDTHNVANVMKTSARSSLSFASTGSNVAASVDFTDEERAKASAKPKT